MTEISASLVKELRDQTGAGMMECKRVLQETEGDIDAARTLLRERGMAAAGKRADRATTEGIVLVRQNGDTAAIVGVGLRDGSRLEERRVPGVREQGARAGRRRP